MKVSLFRRLQNTSSRDLNRYIAIAGAVFAASALLFIGYYVVDRYIRVGNQTPSIVDSGIQNLEKEVRRDPENPEPRIALAQYYMNKVMYDKAVDQVNQVLENFPENETALLVAGTALTRLGKTQEAITRLENLAKLRNDSKSADHSILQTTYYLLGKNYNILGQHDKALSVLELALRIKPTDADALYQAGLASLATKQPDKAVDYFNKSVRLVPDYSEAYTGLIDAYTALGKLDYVAYARGMQAFNQGDYNTAQTHLEFATKAIPDFAPAYYGLALAYEKQKRLAEAYSAINVAAQLDPKNIAIQQAQGRLKNALKVQG